MDLTKVAFEAINERFSKGKYLGVEVIIDMRSGYIQGSHLCAQVPNSKGNPKQFRDWLCTKQYKELCEYLKTDVCSRAGIPSLEEAVSDAPIHLRGVYIHPYLVPHCAQWASPIFAHKVGVIINERAVSEALVKKDRVINSLNENIDKLNSKLDEQNIQISMQSKQIACQTAQISELLGYAISTKEELIETKEVLDDTRDLVVESQQELEKTTQVMHNISNKLGIVRQEVVVPDVKLQNRFVFCVYRHTKEVDKYKVFRCQKKSMSQSIKTCKEKDYTVQVYKIESPNPINLWNRVKNKFPEDIGKIKNLYYVELADDATQEEFLSYLDKTNQEKLEYGE